MNLVHEIELSIFTEVPENKELNVLYSLNQQNTPEVGGLESINDLSKLIKMSAINFYVLIGNKIIGFVICIRENSEYKSPNYNYFKNKELMEIEFDDGYVVTCSLEHKFMVNGNWIEAKDLQEEDLVLSID